MRINPPPTKLGLFLLKKEIDRRSRAGTEVNKTKNLFSPSSDLLLFFRMVIFLALWSPPCFRTKWRGFPFELVVTLRTYEDERQTGSHTQRQATQTFYITFLCSLHMVSPLPFPVCCLFFLKFPRAPEDARGEGNIKKK